jgi:hypothetical protein
VQVSNIAVPMCIFVLEMCGSCHIGFNHEFLFAFTNSGTYFFLSYRLYQPYYFLCFGLYTSPVFFKSLKNLKTLKITAFRRMDLSSSSGKKGGETFCWIRWTELFPKTKEDPTFET